MPINTDFYALNLGQLETETLQMLWIATNEDSTGYSPDASFNKYSRYRVDRAINQAYLEMSFIARALRSWFILPLKANYTQYPVPAGIFDIEKVFYFQSATSYTELPVEDMSFLDEHLSPGWMAFPSIPEYAYVGDRTGMQVKLGVAPASKNDATPVTIASGAYTTTRPYGSVDAVTGAAGPSSSGTSYVDSVGQDFDDLGLVIGLRILNITTGISGLITSITTTVNPYDTINSSVSWTAGDTMRVLGGEVGSTMSIGDDEATLILSPTRGNFPQPLVTMAKDNLLVRGFSLPVLLVSRYQYPELNPYFHEAVAIGAAGFLGVKEPTESLEYVQAQAYSKMFEAKKAELRAFVANQYKTDPGMISVRKR